MNKKRIDALMILFVIIALILVAGLVRMDGVM